MRIYESTVTRKQNEEIYVYHAVPKLAVPKMRGLTRIEAEGLSTLCLPRMVLGVGPRKALAISDGIIERYELKNMDVQGGKEF